MPQEITFYNSVHSNYGIQKKVHQTVQDIRLIECSLLDLTLISKLC